MATILLSVVGTLVAGPIGGAIGAAVGQQLDRAIIGNGPTRVGPRIKELQIQTSSYGTQVPAIFGAMRVAGTVIWSTDLIERSNKTGGSKNRPGSVSYSYSASFAVALSSRPLARVGRIWADGNIIRGAAGDFKTDTLFRFYDGHDDQPLDSLIASAETSGQSPAYRGLSYVVFEDLQLADFGNRIPSLTFEVFERDTPVPLVEIAAATSGGAITGNSDIAVTGYAAQGSDCRSVMEPLASALPITLRPSDGKLAIEDWAAASPVLFVGDFAVSEAKNGLDRPSRSRAASNQAPAVVTIRHYEPGRDFQAGVQTSRRAGSSRREEQIELAVAIDAAEARRLADLQQLLRRRMRNGFEASLPIRGNAVQAGHRIADADGALFRITEVEYRQGTARIVGQLWADDPIVDLPADPGRNLEAPDLSVGDTRLLLADLPAFGAEDPARPIVVAAVAGTGAGWRRAALTQIDGQRVLELGGTNGVATIGTLVGELPPHSALLEDLSNQPVIRLLHDGMTLPTGSGTPHVYDAPALWVDGEIIRYGSAEKIGPREYRLVRLLRGCFGIGSGAVHVDGCDTFVIESAGLFGLEATSPQIDTTLKIAALGIGDTLPTEKTLLVRGAAVTPRVPVHGSVEKRPNGDIFVSWVRRERLPYNWHDGSDMPNSEGSIEFTVELFANSANVATWNVANSSLLVSATMLSSLSIAAGTNIQFAISQQGRFARSAPHIVETTY